MTSNSIRDCATKGKQLWELRDMKNAEEERLEAARFMFEQAKGGPLHEHFERLVTELELSVKDYYARIREVSGNFVSLTKHTTNKIKTK